jgi:serine/threonine protein kinase
MTLSPGTHLGAYEVVTPIGAGGMGEVYQAHDTKLAREVAIKVLPEAFAHDPDRLSRFQREAKMLAALNHPAIATIYGLEQTNGTSYLVMELASGETLQQRVTRGGRLPIEDVLGICRQIAEALEAAHEKGIIHRDLKPANVKVTAEESESSISVYDIARDTFTPLTFHGGLNLMGAWTPDGKRIVFDSAPEGQIKLVWQSADGSGGPEPLTTGTGENLRSPSSWSPNGQLAFVETAPTAGADIWMLQLSDHKAQPFLRTAVNESAPQFSPDGRWLAYMSDASTRFEIYVQPYPGSGGKRQISTNGGTEPVWNRNRRELFYRSGNKMMAVDITTEPGFTAGKPHMLFEGPYQQAVTLPNYDVSPDGQHFLMLKSTEQAQAVPTQINVVLNWFEELKQKVPVGLKK